MKAQGGLSDRMMMLSDRTADVRPSAWPPAGVRSRVRLGHPSARPSARCATGKTNWTNPTRVGQTRVPARMPECPTERREHCRSGTRVPDRALATRARIVIPSLGRAPGRRVLAFHKLPEPVPAEPKTRMPEWLGQCPSPDSGIRVSDRGCPSWMNLAVG